MVATPEHVKLAAQREPKAYSCVRKVNTRIQYTAQFHLHKLDLYAYIQTKYTFARTYASNTFTVSTSEWLPLGSEIKGKRKKIKCKRKGKNTNRSTVVSVL